MEHAFVYDSSILNLYCGQKTIFIDEILISHILASAVKREHHMSSIHSAAPVDFYVPRKKQCRKGKLLCKNRVEKQICIQYTYHNLDI